MTLKEPERHVLIAHNRKKSQEAIEQVAWLIDNRQWHLAMNRIYYGIYYMLSAVAIQERFETTKHQQLIGWFNKTYIKTGLIDKKHGKSVRRAYENRMEGDYNVLSEFTEDLVRQAFTEMQALIAAIEALLDQGQKQP